MLEYINVNRTGRITEGVNEGVVGRVIGADWVQKIVWIEDSEGCVVKTDWDKVEQFKD